jgi:hypothetical protein
MNNEQEMETQNSEEVLELEEEEAPEEEEEEEKPQKSAKEFTDEEKLARIERMRGKLLKKLGRNEDPTPVSKKSKEEAPKSGDLNYGELAFYNTKSDIVKIESDEDIEFLQETIAETGKPQKDILKSKWFQAELKERADARRSADAVPKGTKRSGQSSKDSVDYWLAQDKLPENTPENQDLRRKVVAEKRKRAESTNHFAPAATGSIVRQSQQRK